ncbi:DUF6472 family protein [Congzhengia minquanensis]|nr:DUF6472 family protein [Congzhengia minquanensis]
MDDTLCENCMNFTYDEDSEDYACCRDLDEDEMLVLLSSRYQKCPYFRFGDDYTIVKKQN